jgi:hypothetical protein
MEKDFFKFKVNVPLFSNLGWRTEPEISSSATFPSTLPVIHKKKFRPQVLRAGIFKQSMGARNRVEIGLSYRPARLHRLAEFIPWNRFLGSINVEKYGLVST